jgi:molybdopterin synthase catalytic subunit
MTTGSDRRYCVTSEPLDSNVVAAAVSSPQHGALAMFVGLVRGQNAGHRVLWIDYEGFEPLALKCFAQIGREAAVRWPAVELAIHHRLGAVAIGEASVAIAAGSAHRADACAAARFAIERVKQIAPIWKHEHFEGGNVWIEGATADPDDEAAREAAFERACS